MSPFYSVIYYLYKMVPITIVIGTNNTIYLNFLFLHKPTYLNHKILIVYIDFQSTFHTFYQHYKYLVYYHKYYIYYYVNIYKYHFHHGNPLIVELYLYFYSIDHIDCIKTFILLFLKSGNLNFI